jgi:hypothetical protein
VHFFIISPLSFRAENNPDQGKDSGIWEVGVVRGFSQMGWGFRAVAVVAALVEALVHFLCQKGRKKGICFRLCGGFSSMMGQGELSGSESSLRI